MAAHQEPLNALSVAYEEALYAQYLQDPSSVPEDWRRYFGQLASGNGGAAAFREGPSFRPSSLFNPPSAGGNGASALEMAYKQDRLDEMIRAFRVRGHTCARLSPLDERHPEECIIRPEDYGFTEADMDLKFSTRTIHGPDMRPLREIVQRMRNTYCRSIGVEFMHISDLGIRTWLQTRMESTENRLPMDTGQQVRILTRLTDAIIFEEFIQKKFLGAKSFSLEGAESLIPLLDLAIESAGEYGVKEIVIGMAHRGRLNVLANILGKSPREIFREFEDMDPDLYSGGGDVKYHLGYHNDWITSTGKEIHLALCFNPSHLEFVNPVALGRTRAKQERLGDHERERYVVILIHGDAAIAGEGIVQETLNLSQLEPYTTGGTIHVVVNNQIGFTTPPEQGRSGVYATDIAKMLQVPIFHVNGEDPEAVAQVVKLAMEFRKEFKRDVVIDMYCYRRRGHNESDEPSFTQPLMYKIIEKRKSVRDAYLERLLKLGGITKEQADQIAEARRQELEKELSEVRSKKKQKADEPPRPSILGRVWSNYVGGPESGVPDVDTGFDRQYLAVLLDRLTHIPRDFNPHPKIQRFLENRREMARGERPLDWSAGEALAFATLAVERYPVRLTGQDSERGTFSHRHAVLHDVTNGDRFFPFMHLSEDQAPVHIHNSPLSEAGVLGFEYGYSIAYPDALVMWEAQFGDFCNAAQVIVDQFITSAEDKWRSLSGLVLLLPHGFEGMGPEHSSARLERFLMLAAEDNIQVTYPTTPAQFFHLLRRQVHRPWRKPLIVMTPKSLLRHPEVISSLDDLASGRFRRVLQDPRFSRRKKVSRVLLCTGKVYYDLDRARVDLEREDLAMVRLEQLYPFPHEELQKALSVFPEGTKVVWTQEEPENMGAWRYLKVTFGDNLYGRHPLSCVSRPPSASPATGSANSHHIETERLGQEAVLGDGEQTGQLPAMYKMR
jgi:2-oxoglutarate dehydrogenase E1 component